MSTLSLLEPFEVHEFQKIRVGNNFDGGYVMLDDFSHLNLALSFGIGNDVSWDLKIAERVKVLQFDHTVNGPPLTHHNFIFFKKKIVGSYSAKLDEVMRTQEITVEDILRDINDLESSIIKIDIENDEWSLLHEINSSYLKKFSQILIEFHDLGNVDKYEYYKVIFEKITKNHFVFHVHANNWAPIKTIANIPIPDVIEVSLASRQHYQPRSSRTVYPTSLDFPNKADTQDFFLGPLKFKNIMNWNHNDTKTRPYSLVLRRDSIENNK